MPADLEAHEDQIEELVEPEHGADEADCDDDVVYPLAVLDALDPVRALDVETDDGAASGVGDCLHVAGLRTLQIGRSRVYLEGGWRESSPSFLVEGR